MTPVGAGVSELDWVGELGLDRVTGVAWPSMGVRADDRPWPDPEGANEERLALRRRIAAEHPETVAALPGSEAAVAELAALARGTGWSDTARHGALPALATTQGDDLCVLAAEPGWPLVAGAVLFPSHWRLADKLGLPLAAVHERVPGYPAAQVDRFLDRLRPGQVAWRRNLLLHRDGTLHAPDPATDDVPVADWWLRSERQTFRVLPDTGAVLFTIHTDTTPLAGLEPGTRHALAERIAALPPTWAPYADVGDHLPDLIADLRQ